jgi:hypothetical protein
MKEPSTNDTILGRPFVLRLEDGTTRDLVLLPFRVRDFMALFPHFDDEPALVARACGLAAGEELTPESYDAVATALQEINVPFFAYCSRRMAGLNRMQNPALERAAEKAMREHLSSAAGSSGLRPPAA